MAETGIAMVAEPPLHLRELQAEARRQTAHFFRDDAMDHEAGAFYERAYQALRVRAYQREMEPFIQAAARTLACKLRPIIVQDGRIVTPEGDPLDPEVRKWLDDAASMVRRHYQLDRTNV